jgi:hypothetical protein
LIASLFTLLSGCKTAAPESLDGYVRELGYVPLPAPRSNWSPGLIFEFQQGQIMITESAEGKALPVAAVPRRTGTTLTDASSYSAATSLGFNTKISPSSQKTVDLSGALSRSNVQTFTIDAAELTTDHIDLGDVRRYLSGDQVPSDFAASFKGDRYLVVETVSTKKLTYDFSKAQTGSAIFDASLTSQLAEAGLSANSIETARRTGRLQVDQPVALGYKAVVVSKITKMGGTREFVLRDLAPMEEQQLRSATSVQLQPPNPGEKR